MFTKLANAVLCERVSPRPDGMVDLAGVIAARTLYLDTRPGLLVTTLWMLVEGDGEPSIGRMTIKAPGYDVSIPLEMPGDYVEYSLDWRITAAVREAGDLVVMVEPYQGEPFTVTWRVEFAPDARSLSLKEREQVDKAAREARRKVAAMLAARLGSMN